MPTAGQPVAPHDWRTAGAPGRRLRGVTRCPGDGVHEPGAGLPQRRTYRSGAHQIKKLTQLSRTARDYGAVVVDQAVADGAIAWRKGAFPLQPPAQFNSVPWIRISSRRYGERQRAQQQCVHHRERALLVGRSGTSFVGSTL